MRTGKIIAAVSAVSFLFVFKPSEVKAQTATPLKETVVTASRIETPKEQEGRSIDLRTREDFDEQQTSSLTDSLQTVAGVRTQNLGGPGSPGTTPIEIRGFGSSGTQLLFNGLRLNDPSSISGISESYFSYLTSNDLQSVELLKGSNGVMYGSDGRAGSLNLISEKPKEGASAELTFRGGSFQSFDEIAKLNVGNKDIGLVTTVTRLDSRGLDQGGNYENTTVASVGKVKLSEELSLSPMFRMVSAKNDLNSSPTVDANGVFIPNLPTASNQVDAKSYFYGLTGDYTPCEGFSSKLSTYANIVDRAFFFDFGGGFTSNSAFKGDSYNVDWQNALKLDALDSVLVGGMEYEHQTYDTSSGGADDEGSQDRYAAYVKNKFSFFEKILTVDVGGRLTHVSRIDRTLPVFETAAVLNIPTLETRVHSSLSQGFRAPSLFEVQGKIIDETNGSLVNVGNNRLKPEETLSFDVGVTQPFFDKKIELDLTFFNLASQNAIVFDYPNQTHFNGGGGENQGLEYSLTTLPFDWWKIRGAYTYLAKANVGGDRIQRRPYNVFSIASSVRVGIANWYTELRFRDSEDLQFFGVTDRYRESGYTVLDTAVTVPVSSNVELFVRGNNLFDTDYTNSGYRMPGISFFGGIKLKLG